MTGPPINDEPWMLAAWGTLFLCLAYWFAQVI